MEYDCVPRIATGLAGGVGMQGEFCGALMGGVLIIGLRHGADIPDDEIKYACYDKTSQFVQAFEAVNGNTHCRELTGIDLTGDDAYQTYKALNLKGKVCTDVVSNAVHALMGLMVEWER